MMELAILATKKEDLLEAARTLIRLATEYESQIRKSKTFYFEVKDNKVFFDNCPLDKEEISRKRGPQYILK